MCRSGNLGVKKITVGITMGDPAGCGPAALTDALSRLDVGKTADFVVIGDKWVFDKIILPQAPKTKNYTFIDLNNVGRRHFAFGRLKGEYGCASVEYLERAVALIKAGRLDCLVTCPVSKEAINLAGFNFTGHTEYLAERFGVKDYAMMLLNRQIKISLLTRHIPLAGVAACINKRNIRKTVGLTCRALKKLFLIDAPRIVVCGLNPHASDNGFIGKEENRIIKPAIKGLGKALNCRIEGPLSADVALLKTKQKIYDCAVAMYHDQALIPLKLAGIRYAANLTLGLPIVRASPLHGAAFDIAANSSLVDSASLRESIKLAIKCTLNLRKA